MKTNITIGITDCGSYQNYEKWILKEGGITVIKLSYRDNNFDDIQQCDGIVLSGGEDIHPKYYHNESHLAFCHEIDELRDAFEWKVLEFIKAHDLPMLGICRGLQVANVFFGGTLIPDIPSFGKYNHSKFTDKDRYHAIAVDPDSELAKISGSTSGEVNSAHHQSADMIGKGLVANAFSPEGVIEGIERRSIEGQAYLLLVQWHPERMTEQENVFSRKIKESFLLAVRKADKSKIESV